MAILLRFFQFLPLSVFLYFSRENIETGTADWGPAFQWGAVAAAIELAILIPILKTRISRLITAVNIYLIIGGLGFYFYIVKLLNLLGAWRETGLLAIVVIVMLVSTLVCESGAFETTSTSKQLTRKYSLILVGWCVIAAVFSWMNKGQVKMAGVLPFISIVIVKFILEKRLARVLVPQKEKLNAFPK